MVMQSGEHWHCLNPACGCAVVVETSGKIEGQTPLCVCGTVMKRNYSPPAFHYLDFLRISAEAVTHREPSED